MLFVVKLKIGSYGETDSRKLLLDLRDTEPIFPRRFLRYFVHEMIFVFGIFPESFFYQGIEFLYIISRIIFTFDEIKGESVDFLLDYLNLGEFR